MDAGGDRKSQLDLIVIREVYDHEFSHESFSMELEKALSKKVPVIVLEPTQLGDETARWILVGNYIHKTAVGLGLCSIVTGYFWPDRFVPLPLSIASALCTTLYTVSWQFDHCVNYQVEKDAENLKRLQLDQATQTSPVVLVRKDLNYRVFLQWTISFTAAALCVYRLYKAK